MAQKIDKYIGAIPRLHPATLCLQIVYREPYKKSRKNSKTIPPNNFSFILEGRGDLTVNGVAYEIEAPCVFIQAPGAYFEYGPSGTWHEFSLCYRSDQVPELSRRRYSDLRHPTWPIIHLTRIRPLIEEISDIVTGDSLQALIDRADRLADLLILETLSQQPLGNLSLHEQQVLDLKRALDADPTPTLNFQQWAIERGMSEGAFRRIWAHFCADPPLHHQHKLRHAAACRLLLETDLPVSKIGVEVGYQDPFYFSRVFKELEGMPPSKFRNMVLNNALSVGLA